MLTGHLEQQQAFLAATAEGRAHHAWLLAGPPGVGKATFAHAASRHLLAAAAGPAEGIASDTLAVDPEHRVARLLASEAHPDFRLLERIPNERTGKLNAQILIDQIRGFQAVFQNRPSYSDWRAVIIDAVDDVREGAANALLKTLEEPPPNTLMLLVSHSPGRLLPTIRSRCRVLRFKPLADAEVAAVLKAKLPETDPADLATLVKLAAGSPGRALRFAGLDIGELDAALDSIAGARSSGRALDLARSLAGKTAQPRYEAFLELAPAYLATAARAQSGPALAHTLTLWERANTLAAEAMPLQLQAETVAFELASLVSELRR